MMKTHLLLKVSSIVSNALLANPPQNGKLYTAAVECFVFTLDNIQWLDQKFCLDIENV